MNNNEIINTLRARSLPVKVTFNNVERIEDLAGRLAQQVEADSLTLLKQMLDPEFLAVNGFTPETALGMYIPIPISSIGMLVQAALQKRLYKQYEYFWTPRRRNSVHKRGLTLDEAMILASIVQKESQKADEQPLIAQVYINRLNKGMRLQADPTVVFALKKAQNDFSMVIRRVLNKDLKINSPYNTYKIKGLPPGPICMPDISAIDAVIFPEPVPHNYLYFVADPERPGYHSFSKSLREHNRKARSYYRYLNKKKLYR